jgi:hypothetical protein
MALESASIRREKRMVKPIIGGFTSANEAKVFGNTLYEGLRAQIGDFKLKTYIAARGTKLAITKDYIGETVLKMSFLDIKNHNIAMHICDEIRRMVSIHIELRKTPLVIVNIEVAEKPQPQFITR